jgi:ribose transport system permease protein
MLHLLAWAHLTDTTFSIGQLPSVDPLAGNMLELDAIAAVVLGGAGLFGGRGPLIGTLIGTLIMI